jgi:hypothetical protein
MKNILLTFGLFIQAYFVNGQACVGNGTANITFVSSSGGNCTYNISMSVTTTSNSAKAARFSVLNATPIINPVCKTSSLTTINCTNTGNLNNLGNGVVINHTFTNVTIPCNTAPSLSLEGTTANNNFSSLCNAITVTQTNPNPVKISYFNGISQSNKIALNWQTESEIGFSHFVVQRSGNALEFGDLETIKADGESTEKINYRFIDNNPFPGINYYRLRQVDKDGTVSFSKIIDINADGGASEIIIYPNPSTGSFKMKNNETIISSDVYNASGKKIDGILRKEETTYTLDFPNKPESGIYFLKITTASGIKKYRVAIN